MGSRTLSRLIGSMVIGSAGLLAANSSSTATAASCGSLSDPYAYGITALQSCGLHVHPLAKTVKLPGGGTGYVYNVDGGVITYRVPPTSFDPLTASDAELAYYGFPARPTDTDSLAGWERVLHTPRGAAPPFLVQGPNPISRTRAGGVSALSYSCPSGADCEPNWSGYVASGTSFTLIKGSYTEETPTSSQPCSNNGITQWVGLGGFNTINILAQDGTFNDPYQSTVPPHGAFSEVLPAGPVYMHFFAYVGDQIAASVQRYSTGFEFIVADNTSGFSYGYFETTSSYDGSSAEAILERPSLNPTTLLNLTQFQSPAFFYSILPNGNSLNTYSHQQIIMTNNANTYRLAHPGSIFSSNEFYDYYDACG